MSDLIHDSMLIGLAEGRQEQAASALKHLARAEEVPQSAPPATDV